MNAIISLVPAFLAFVVYELSGSMWYRQLWEFLNIRVVVLPCILNIVFSFDLSTRSLGMKADSYVERGSGVRSLLVKFANLLDKLSGIFSGIFSCSAIIFGLLCFSLRMRIMLCWNYIVHLPFKDLLGRFPHIFLLSWRLLLSRFICGKTSGQLFCTMYMFKFKIIRKRISSSLYFDLWVFVDDGLISEPHVQRCRYLM